MMGHTHVAIGLGVGVGIGIATGSRIPDLPVLAGVAALAALLPDIDHPSGAVRQKLGILGHIGLFWLSHRGITHTLLALLAVSAAALHFLPYGLALAAIGGYGSHLVADMVTRAGLPVLWPLYRESIHLLPRGLSIITGGKTETLIFFAILALISLFLMQVSNFDP